MLSKRHLLGGGVMAVLGATTGLSNFGELGGIGGGVVCLVGGVKLALDIEREQAASRNGNGVGR